MVAEGPTDEVPEVPSNEKKRHPDGHSSRSHHSKKLKEPVNCSSTDEVPLSTRSGMDVRVNFSMGTPAVSDSYVRGLRLCKTYVDQVIFYFIFFPF